MNCALDSFRNLKSSIPSLLGPLPPALMDQLAAAAAAQYVNVTQPVVPPGPQATPQAQHPPPPQPSQPQIVRTSSGAIDAAVQTEVTTVVQSKQVSDV